MRKNLFITMAILTMLSLISVSCTNTSEPAPDATKTEAENPNTDDGKTDEPNTADTGDYTNGFPDRVTINIPVYDRAFEGWNVTDNYYTKWMQEEFGEKYNVDVNYVAIGRSTEVTDYQQLLASRKAPDIIFHYDMPQALAYYSEGVMQELDYAEIEKYAPTFWGNSGEVIEQYGKVDGQNTFVFAKRPLVDNWVTLVRKDWVEAAGYKVEDITSLEVYNEMLGKWKELGLGTGMVPFIKDFYIHTYPFREWPVSAEDRALYSDLSVADFTWKPNEDYLRNLNFQYNNGLVDTEFYLRDDEAKRKAEFVSGKVGSFGFYLSSNTDVIDALLANNPEAEFAVLPTAAGVPEGIPAQTRGYWPFGFIMGINYETSEESRIAIWMFLEWMSQPENLFKLQNGIEGENYTLDADGLAVKNADFTGDSALSQNNNKDYWALVMESQQYETPELTEKANRLLWSPVGHEYLVDELIADYEITNPYRTPDVVFTTQIETVAEYKADLNELWQQLWVECVRVSIDDFDATYEKAKQTFLDAGYQEILDEKQAAINAGNFSD